MATEIHVPAIGESVTSGMLAAWLRKEGEYVMEGEELFELETDKANLTVPSPGAGVLHIGVAEGEEVEVGQAVGRIEAGEPPREAIEEDRPEGESELPESESGPAGGESGRPEGTSSPAQVEQHHTRRIPESVMDAEAPADAAEVREGAGSGTLSPAVRRILAENDLPAEAVRGTGKSGRITTEDALRAVEERGREAPAADGRGEQAKTGAGTPPAAGRGTGDGAKAAAGPASVSAPDLKMPAADTGEKPRRREPMSRIRQRIAENLVRSRQSSAHLTTFNEIDMTEVMGLRARYRDEFQERHSTRLGFMSFFIKASVKALAAYPEANAFIDGAEIVYNDYFDIGVALSSERGLITPVVRSADRKSFAQIESEIVSFADRAKRKKLLPDELMGATFTITNGGVFGSLLSTPIPSPPQSAILGMHTIQKRPVVVDDQIVIRPMMYVALTYDHRIIDGREAIGFLMTLKRSIEDPHRMLLDV